MRVKCMKCNTVFERGEYGKCPNCFSRTYAIIVEDIINNTKTKLWGVLEDNQSQVDMVCE